MCDKENKKDGYGEYFMNRSAADIMEEYSEQHDEWEPCKVKDDEEKKQ